MQTSLIKKNQLTKEIKGYLKFYFSSQELTYLTPKKILDTASNINEKIHLKKSSGGLQTKPISIKQDQPSIPAEDSSIVKDFLQKAVNLQEAGSLDSLRAKYRTVKNVIYVWAEKILSMDKATKKHKFFL